MTYHLTTQTNTNPITTRACFTRSLALGCALALALPGSYAQDPTPTDPQQSEAIAKAYLAFTHRDAQAVTHQASLLPRDHLLRPWLQAWAALSDPSTDPSALAAFAKKFPYSLMRWRLFEESSIRFIKADSIPNARLALAALPAQALGPLGRCAAALADPTQGAEHASDSLAQGAASDICSRAAAASLGSNTDAFAAAFARMTPANAARALAGPALKSNPYATAGFAAWTDLMARPRWEPAFPKASQEALSRQVASALGSGQCLKTPMPEPAHLTSRGQANAARCALWTRSLPQALTYWDALAADKPSEPRWQVLRSIAKRQPPTLGFASTSYAQLLSTVVWGIRAPPPSSLLSTPARTTLTPTAPPQSTCNDGGSELALALWRYGARKEASDAWRDVIERSDAPTRACLGVRADALGAHPLRIAAFAGSDYDPRAYAPGFKSFIDSAAAANGLDAELLSSIARQESRYDETALSRTGALGLFQLMPATALETALMARVEPPTPTAILSPQINAELAARHEARMLTQFGGDVVWSLCAYNAGAGRTKTWQASLASLPIALRIEAIPYDETRLYVERILVGWTLSSTPDINRVSFLSHGLAPLALPPSTSSRESPRGTPKH